MCHICHSDVSLRCKDVAVVRVAQQLDSAQKKGERERESERELLLLPGLHLMVAPGGF